MAGGEIRMSEKRGDRGRVDRGGGGGGGGEERE